MHYQKHTGIILKKTPYKDADYFLTILTRDAGKLSVYGRGVRQLKSHRRANLDYFTEISFEVVEHSGRLTLMSVEPLNRFAAGKTKLSDISRLFVIGELIDSLVPESDPETDLYPLLHKALSHLSRFETPTYLIRFKRRLLEHLGYGEAEISDANLDLFIESLLEKPLRARPLSG